ncbi:PKD domain-containing protein [Sunxiuqinia dokdonensis]|uniref:PKD domain-containing protein n=1 Tax=Sunxiuqinia dokdonensis TaxID=1409788 RepID=A0A0L8V2H1_9BACT|nr:hypothetical protein [Sunxiuqinia dokdonensis]KOH42670.1 hypothetical protein NC99_45060 [Sunxiuqinia dokdonensis]
MRKFLLLLLACIGLFSCAKDEVPALFPVAQFETEETYYDDGDVIQFINTSEKASYYLWSFGHTKFSNEPNPEYTIDLKDFLGYKFTAELNAYSADGLKESCSKDFIISKRILLDLHILRMEESLAESIATPSEQQSNLIVYMGPVNEPFEWIVPEQTLPPLKLNIESGYPQKLYVMRTWPRVAMNNEWWFIRLSIQPEEEDADHRMLIKEFRFNPCKTDFVMNEDDIRQFVIEDEEMAIAIDFLYIN